MLSPNNWSLHNISISRIYRLLATCWYLFGVCALSRSRDIAWYHSNSPILLHINRTAYFMERKMEYIYTMVSENRYTSPKIDVFWTAILTLLAPTGNKAQASVLVHQVLCTSATVLWYLLMFMQFSLRVWASEYTCRPIIANLLYHRLRNICLWIYPYIKL